MDLDAINGLMSSMGEQLRSFLDPNQAPTAVASELKDADEEETATLGMFFVGWAHKVLRIPPK